MRLRNHSSGTHMVKNLFKHSSIAIAASVSLLLSAVSQAEVVELSPNELNSAYIKDSTIYIPKATQDRISKKVVNVKIRPGEPSPEEVDREEELRESAKQNVITSLETNQTWETNRIESSLSNAAYTNLPTDPALLPPREIVGAPDGFELPENFSYTAQDLINLGFTHPDTGQPLSPVSDAGIYYGNNYAVGSDGTAGNLLITLPADAENRVPPQGVNSDLLNINRALQNAINMRLQLPEQ